jgi:hypothetical protein
MTLALVLGWDVEENEAGIDRRRHPDEGNIGDSAVLVSHFDPLGARYRTTPAAQSIPATSDCSEITPNCMALAGQAPT